MFLDEESFNLLVTILKNVTSKKLTETLSVVHNPAFKKSAVSYQHLKSKPTIVTR